MEVVGKRRGREEGGRLPDAIREGRTMGGRLPDAVREGKRREEVLVCVSGWRRKNR